MPSTVYPEIQGFLDYLKFEKRYSLHTITSYQTDLEQFFKYLYTQFGAPAIKDITSIYIRSWLAGMRDNKIVAKSINRKISTLKSFFKFQVKTGVIVQTPMTVIISPKTSKRLPAFVSEDDMQHLSDRRIEEKDKFQQETNRLLIDVFYNTGMRLSELINLKTSNIDAANCQIKVLGKGNKERIIPVAGELISKILLYIEGAKEAFPDAGHQNVFINKNGRPLYPKYVYLVVKRNLNNITTLKKKSPHVLRHTFATHLMNNGADLNAVKELLGHSSLAATQIYTHNTIDKLKDIHKKAHPKA